MTAHLLAHREERRPLSGRPGSNGLIQLRWSDFWLLAGILAGMLALVALVYQL